MHKFVLVGHGYGGSIISKVVEAIPERMRRLVFWSAFVLNDGELVAERAAREVVLVAGVIYQASAASPPHATTTSRSSA